MPMPKLTHVFLLITVLTAPLTPLLLTVPTTHHNVVSPHEGPYLPIINSTLHLNYTEKCGLTDLACHLRNFLRWVISSLILTLTSSGRAIGEWLFKPLVNATLKVVISVPVFVPSNVVSNETLKQLSPYVFYSIGPAVSKVYSITYWLSYVIAGAALFISAIMVMLEGSVVRQGEAVASLKRVALVLILLPLLNYIYNYSAVGVAWMNSALFNLGVAKSFITTATGVASVLLGASSVLVGIAVLAPVVLVAFIMLVLGALRLLLTATLACVLPLAVALTLVPLRPIRDVGMHLITTLVNLLLSTTLAAVMLRLCAEVGAILYGVAQHSVTASVLCIIMVTASLCTPALSLMMAPRAGIVMFATSYFFGYVAQPAIRVLSRPLETLRRGAIYAAEAAMGVPALRRVVRHGVTVGRVVARGVPHYIITRMGEK